MRVAFLLLFLLPAGLFSCKPPPTDAEMIAFFHKNRAAFEEIRAYSLELRKQGVARVDRRFLDPEWEKENPDWKLDDEKNLTLDQRQRLGGMMDALGVEILQVIPTLVSLMVYRRGLAVSGSLKEYVWSLDPQDPLVDTLDAPLVKEGYVTESWFSAYRKIEGNWYLHYSDI